MDKRKVACGLVSILLSGCTSPQMVENDLGAQVSTHGNNYPAQYIGTGKTSDLAIEGPGYFVVSTKATPSDPSDLLFTRAGSFRFQPLSESPGKSALVTKDGLYVIGFSVYISDKDASESFVPSEILGGRIAAGRIDSYPTGAKVALKNIVVSDSALMGDSNKFAINGSGQLRFFELDREEQDESGGRIEQYLALANPERKPLTPSDVERKLNYENLGEFTLGVASTIHSTNVGNSNTILPEVLEK